MRTATPSAQAANVLTLVALASIGLLFIGGGWVSDDWVHLLRLTHLSSPWSLVQDADAFGFYRPIAQITLWLEGQAHGLVPPLFRATNVLLHVAVSVLAYLVGCRLMTPRAAFFATLAFILAPKVPTIACLWVSARPELLMSLFVLVACWAWLRWHQDGGRLWIAMAGVADVLAFLSKESAALLPLVLLLLVPATSPIVPRQRYRAAAAMLALAAIPIALRLSAGALMPTTVHEHYALDFSAYRFFRSLQVYVPRALPSPLALVALVALLATRTSPWTRWSQTSDVSRIASVSIAWFLAFMLPVLPIPLRSELYLYLPGLGLCFLAGYLVDHAMPAASARSALFRIALVAYVVALLGYQQFRNMEAHRIQAFTGALVESLRADERLRSFEGQIRFTAFDPASEDLMRDGVGGYINGVTAIAIPGNRFGATVQFTGEPADGNAQAVTYRYVDGRVLLEH